MKKNGTELVFILDKSGSMAGLESDTIGGFNAMLAKQKKEEGEATITTVLFNHAIELLHDRINIRGISPITKMEYEVSGTTALLDAIGSTIQKIGNTQKRTNEEERAGKVLFVITTDGMENASCEYNYDKIKAMISNQKEKYSWDFIFLGANIDAISTAAKFGIQEEHAVEYHADIEGTRVNYQAVNDAVTSFRKGKKIDRTWKKGIEENFQNRKQ
ncbi:vWA domain-containing protein [Psychrobacillus sp. L4]|uniref:vWA domain-containing protein n=1 Tax=Psychrobacillus sp. L4 TaxID=3236892 RepID=UPI0036F43E52